MNEAADDPEFDSILPRSVTETTAALITRYSCRIVFLAFIRSRYTRRTRPRCGAPLRAPSMASSLPRCWSVCYFPYVHA